MWETGQAPSPKVPPSCYSPGLLPRWFLGPRSWVTKIRTKQPPSDTCLFFNPFTFTIITITGLSLYSLFRVFLFSNFAIDLASFAGLKGLHSIFVLSVVIIALNSILMLIYSYWFLSIFPQ